MKRYLIRFLSFALCAALLFAGVPVPGSAEWNAGTELTFSQMEYTRPDLEEMRSILDHVCTLAQGKGAISILNGVGDFYDAYDWFYTCYSLADIHYSMDLTDTYWREENDFCVSASGQVDQMLTELYTALAASPVRNKLEKMYFGEGFFLYYDDETDEEADERLSSLYSRESELILEYYTESAKGSTILGSILQRENQMAQILVDLISVRNDIAGELGYDSYESYAYDYLYLRDYTPEQMATLLEEIRRELVPLYIRHWQEAYTEEPSTQEGMLDYLRTAASAMGGTVQDAFDLMERRELYDIKQSRKKYNSSFETFLLSYGVPYVFVCPDGSEYDNLTFAHEFGHFCNDYALGYQNSSVDTGEVFSQAMEYLSLLYAADGELLTGVKLADSLCTYVDQARYAQFEREMYRLPEEERTVAGLKALYGEICAEYGAEDIPEDDFVYVTHFYTDPMYICSYIVSNDAAMQIYQMELEESGAGLHCFEENLYNPEYLFLAFLDGAGLDSPFAPGHMTQMAETFTRILEDTAAAA